MTLDAKTVFGELEARSDEDRKSYILSVAKDAGVKFCRLQFTDILGIPKNIGIRVDRLEEDTR